MNKLLYLHSLSPIIENYRPIKEPMMRIVVKRREESKVEKAKVFRRQRLRTSKAGEVKRLRPELSRRLTFESNLISLNGDNRSRGGVTPPLQWRFISNR
ncbi:MAG TPA: hypothetical protein ACFYD6_00915 [Candidatus Brocadiia bacterium]|nr:hypothetical protein [Candidatus Brocadiales bacterium]